MSSLESFEEILVSWAVAHCKLLSALLQSASSSTLIFATTWAISTWCFLQCFRTLQGSPPEG